MSDTDYASLIRVEPNAYTMREEIADGLEQSQSYATAAVNTANNANNTANNANNRVDAIIVGTGASDSVEVSAAHYDNTTNTTYDSLGKRLDDHSTKIVENASLQADVIIKTTDDPQAIFDATPAGSKIIFEGGLHQHGLTKYNSFLYVDKPMRIEIPSTATLKVADGSMHVNKNAELITNFNASNPITSLAINTAGCTLGDTVKTYEIAIDGTATPNTFKFQTRDFNNNVIQDWSTNNTITGNDQLIGDGIYIKFPQTTGYTLGAGCIVAVGSVGYYVIRVGMGIQSSAIDSVEIMGQGVIDQNQQNNAYSNLYALWLNCGLLINGSVTNFKLVDKIRFRNCNRTIVCLGENVGGIKNLDGTITGGTNYQIDTVTIKETISDIGNISGALFGMPEHRGIINNLVFEDNEIYCSLTGIEPNNLLQNYSVRFNKIYYSANPIHCWRASKNGTVRFNIAYNTTGGFGSSSPAGWAFSTNLTIKDNEVIDNINGLGNSNNGDITNTIANSSYTTIGGGINNSAQNNYSTIGGGAQNIINAQKSTIGGGSLNNITGDESIISGGDSNSITGGAYNTITGGQSNQINNVSYATASGYANIAQHSVSRVAGKQAKTKFNYSDVYASGSFATTGDAQISRVIQKNVTTDATPTVLTFDGTFANDGSKLLVLPINATWAYKITLIGRDSSGAYRGMWEAVGLATRVNNTPVIEGGTITKIFATNSSWNGEVIVSSNYNALVVRATGVTGETIRWVAKIELLEVEY